MHDLTIYAPGEAAPLFCDLYPASITVVVRDEETGELTRVNAPGVPPGRTPRALIFDRVLVIAWQNGANAAGAIIDSVGIPLREGETEGATLRGGDVGPVNELTGEPMYRVAIAAGCRTCGAGAIKRWKPFPESAIAADGRMDQARQQGSGRSMTGLVPTRYTR